MLGVLAVGLYPQLRNEQVAYLCHLVRVLHNTQDYLALVALLLQVGQPADQGQRGTCYPIITERGASLPSRGWPWGRDGGKAVGCRERLRRSVLLAVALRLPACRWYEGGPRLRVRLGINLRVCCDVVLRCCRVLTGCC